MRNNHNTYMMLAFSLAQKGKKNAPPNPLVGCVLVKNKKIISTGYHAKFGGPHAEINALKKVSPKNVSGSTAYLTLEPCSHWGKTGPCCEALISAGIREVYISVQDPNPLVSGQGIRYLRQHGCRVHVGLMAEEGERLISPFKAWILRKRPHVTLKMAQTLDGKIALKSGESKWISCDASRRYVHQLRSEMNALVIGTNTAIKDNPFLTSHGIGHNPKRIVIDPHLRTPSNLNMYKHSPKTTLLVTTLNHSQRKLQSYKERGITIWTLPLKGKRLDLKKMLNLLLDAGYYKIMIEGGGDTAWSFLSQNLVDEVFFFMAPKIMGGVQSINAVGGEGVHSMKELITVKNMTAQTIGTDILVRGYLN